MSHLSLFFFYFCRSTVRLWRKHRVNCTPRFTHTHYTYCDNTVLYSRPTKTTPPFHKILNLIPHPLPAIISWCTHRYQDNDTLVLFTTDLSLVSKRRYILPWHRLIFIQKERKRCNPYFTYRIFFLFSLCWTKTKTSAYFYAKLS